MGSREEIRSCPRQYVLAINDTLNVVSGKWKLPIIASLMFEKRRFSEIQSNIGGITPRMLSKELKDLEMNGIVLRKALPATSSRFEYELTKSGAQIVKVLDVMIDWGLTHRETIKEH